MGDMEPKPAIFLPVQCLQQQDKAFTYNMPCLQNALGTTGDTEFVRVANQWLV